MGTDLKTEPRFYEEITLQTIPFRGQSWYHSDVCLLYIPQL